MAMLRLCQRLLPYNIDISEPLMKGEQYMGQAVQWICSIGCHRQYNCLDGLYSVQAVLP